jgi:DNA-binding PadR family transcriptional regulator
MTPQNGTGKSASRGKCARHGSEFPCTCAMGHLYRFIEPVLLLMIRERGQTYGYDLSNQLGKYAFTDAEIERAALYRTLKVLEANGCVVSQWDVEGSGPARKLYSLTPVGERHLRQWAQVLDKVGRSMFQFVHKVEALPASRGRAHRRISRSK